MAKWLTLPREKLFYQAEQQAFLNARRGRICRACQIEFQCLPPTINCPNCDAPGERIFDRLTIIAGRRFGKSLSGSIAGAEEATIPGSVGWACAPTVPKLHRYVIPAFQQLIPEDWVESWSAEFLDLRLKNGSLIHFQTLEDPDQGRGQGLDWLWIDEVCELSLAHWDVIRPSLAGNTVAFFTTSPRGYDWVYNSFYKPAVDGTLGYWAALAMTASSANPRISAEFLAREKAQMSPEMYAQEYEASFVIFTGSVYGGLVTPQILRTDEAVKTIIPEWPKIEPWRQVIVGIDTGATHPFGAVKLVSTDKGLIVVDEYLERNGSTTYLQHAAALHRLAGSSNVRWAINKNERQGMIELAQHGINCQPSENDVVAGTERVKSWLHQKQLWFAESRCPQTIKQMSAYRWADSEAKDGQLRKEKVYKLEDELPDGLRYSVMTWPTLPKGPPAIEAKSRDISNLPIKMQQDIAAIRKIEQRDKLPKNDATMDFYS